MVSPAAPRVLRLTVESTVRVPITKQLEHLVPFCGLCTVVDKTSFASCCSTMRADILKQGSQDDICTCPCVDQKLVFLLPKINCAEHVPVVGRSSKACAYRAIRGTWTNFPYFGTWSSSPSSTLNKISLRVWYVQNCAMYFVHT